MTNLSSKFALYLFTALVSVFSFTNGSAHTANIPVEYNSVISTLDLDENYTRTRVRISNRTDYRVKVYVDGVYFGKVSSDDYEYFRINPGYHRVTVQWPSGYYEWFDFYVGCGNTHKIWTSDYDF